MNLDSNALIAKLKNENYDQFLTLVRMHLSFIVEINTDDVDTSTEKQKPFKWGFSKKPRNHSGNGSQTLNQNSAKPEICTVNEDDFKKVYEIIEFLSQPDNIKQVGIFRLTGSVSRQQELKQLVLAGNGLHLGEGKFSVHDAASVLKSVLAELPEPLLMEEYYQTYCCLCAQHSPTNEASRDKFLTALQLLLLFLSSAHRIFLQRLLSLLKLVADNEEHNKMSPEALATMFTPHLLCPRKLPPEILRLDVGTLAPVISFMITNNEAVLEVPSKLATDIAAYFTIRERKKMLSPNIDLDESITDRTAANTIFSFVDRTRSNAESEANPTDTALAQLYAHIHSLPDSQHKRRLIKQFNRQNGYGTPIQVPRTNKSLGESIKRHIFHKGILNKTPKKSSTQSPSTFDKPTPNLREKTSQIEVSHKNIIMKNFQNHIASTPYYEEAQDLDSDSNESTLSDGGIVTPKPKKLSSKFQSEPNLSMVESRIDDVTPKNSKKRGTRLFRSKNVLTTNKKYAPKRKDIKGTPISCASCFDDQDTASENEVSNANIKTANSQVTPDSLESDDDSSNSEEIRKITTKYLTSTPGLVGSCDQDDCVTPYMSNLRRASMSPITKSTQKLSKAMQESIMTPRSRQPLIITAELMDNSIMAESKINENRSASVSIYESISPKNDSDFISSDESGIHNSGSKTSAVSKTPDSESDTNNGGKILSDPFREYLLGRSVLTASPVDLSFVNKSQDILNNSEDKLSDSLLYCLDGNMPSELTTSINELAMSNSGHRQALASKMSLVNTEKGAEMSPLRKRNAVEIGGLKNDFEVEKKKMAGKENLSAGNDKIWESDL